MATGLPSINVTFKQAGVTAIARGSRGIVMLILKDSVENGVLNTYSTNDIPTTLSTYNKKQLQDAWLGGVNVPSKVMAYILPDTSVDYSAALTALANIRFNYLAIPGIAVEDVTNISSWVKSMRDNSAKKIKAVLPHSESDHEGIINFDTNDIVTDTGTYSATDYCARIAGLLAGTPLDQSCTYHVLSEVNDVPHLTLEELNAAVAAGKFIIMNDGTKCKIARGINSLITTTQDKGTDYQKIKLIDIMDQISDDIHVAIEDNYIGKYANSYSNKCLLITAIDGYFDGLIQDSIVEAGYTLDVNSVANSIYLKSKGIDVSTYSVKQLKEANTGDAVYLAGKLTILDAIEDFDLQIGI